MKRCNQENINTPSYWDKNQTALDFGLRQQKYLELAGIGTSIAEIGCGLSPFLNEARNNFTFCFGFDFSPETIKRAKIVFPKVSYYEIDANKLEFNKDFDVVVAGEIIKHLEDPNVFIENLEKMAISRIVISTPILEFNDPEHLWEFDEDYFIKKGFKTEIVSSSRFKGRSYIFAWKDL